MMASVRSFLFAAAVAFASGFASVPYEQDISAAFPYDPHFISVLDSTMHYVEAGDPEGAPIVLVHGNPTSSYLWRNVIPHLEQRGRVIAVDLVGYGKSGKPGLYNGMNYTLLDHARYFTAFIDQMGLKNIYFVGQDWGGQLSVDYAVKHLDNVKGLAFFEAVIKAWPGYEVFDPRTAQFFQLFRSSDGPAAIYEQNLFMELSLSASTGRPMTEAESNHWRAPFIDPPTRLPQLTFPNQLPIGGLPLEPYNIVTSNYEALQAATQLPVLFLTASPGIILPPAFTQEIIDEIPRMKVVDIGYGLHDLQETSPTKIGTAINDWLLEVM